MKHAVLFLLTQIFFFSFLKAQNANDTINTREIFPDSLFRAKVFEIADSNGDKKIQLGEVWNINKLDISGQRWTNEQKISSIKGIDIFTNLDTLICMYLDLDTINLSDNSKIKYLNCRSNYSIQSIILPANSPLTYLQCDNNLINNLDLYGQENLEELICYANWTLSRLDIQGTSLTWLDFVEVPELEICIDSQEYWDAIPNKNTNSDYILNFNCSLVTAIATKKMPFKDEVIKIVNLNGQLIDKPNSGELVIYIYKSGKRKKVVIK